jgi:hypothetical protein
MKRIQVSRDEDDFTGSARSAMLRDHIHRFRIGPERNETRLVAECPEGLRNEGNCSVATQLAGRESLFPT